MRSAVLLKMFVAVPLLPVLIAWTLWGTDEWPLVLAAGVLLYYPVQQLGQAIGYHKLFAHRAFVAKPWYPYVACFFASIAFYGDPLSAAMIHRIHHRYSDTDKDPHSPLHGRLHAYIGWMATYKPNTADARCIADLLRDFPWMVTFRKYEWLLPWVFHGALYALSPLVSCAVLIACLLSIHNALAVNAFSHNPNTSDSDKAVDAPHLARWVNPIFLHRHHHKHGSLVDYSAHGVTDYWAKFIHRFLAKPSTK
jgi:stearoyl-CoA desaturase (delta-9 desaturase)